MKILFIDPPFNRFMGFYRVYYPLGLATMASVLHQQGHTVEIFDAEHSPNTDTLSWAQASTKCNLYNDALRDDSHPTWCEIKNHVKQFKPRVVGISVLSVKVASALKIARMCKEIDPNLIVVVGADHPTVFPSIVLENPDVDIVVRGEGESTILNLTQALEKDGMNGSLVDIDGISYRNNKQVVHNQDRPLISKLDDIPFPRIEALVQFKTYRPVDFGAIMTTRGCPYHCTFCGVHNVWSRKVRYRSIQNVLEEIILLREKYGTDYFSFRDASFTIKRDRIILFCDGLIRRNLHIRWECLTRPDLLDQNLLQKMKEAGCVTIRIGIESGDETILQRMKKQIDLKKIKEAAGLLNRMKFYWSAYFLFGTPQETQNSIQRTLKFIKIIDPPFVTLSRFVPIPGSEFYEDLDKEGIVSPYIDWSLENNQRVESHYLLNMKPAEFEQEMKNVIDYVEEHNQRKGREIGIRDARLM
jgi:radical SAM superfamily enzyme YgiQ (UPF0313 family)